MALKDQSDPGPNDGPAPQRICACSGGDGRKTLANHSHRNFTKSDLNRWWRLHGVVLYALLSQAGLEFLGLGDPSAVTWGTMLYWAQNNSSLFTGAWWDVFTAIIAVFGGALALINMSIDQVSNPKLKTGPHLKLWKSLSQKLEIQRGQR